MARILLEQRIVKGLARSLEISKAYGKKDTSKLVKKQITDKNGNRTTVWVKPDENKNNDRVKLDRNSIDIENLRAMKEPVSRGDKIIFDTSDGSEVSGTVVSVGSDGVTVKNKGVAYQVEYKKIKRNITKKGFMTPENFNAASYKNKYQDFKIAELEKSSKGAGVAYFLEEYYPGEEGEEIKRKCEETEARVDRQKAKQETIFLHRMSGEGKDAVYTEERSRLHARIINSYLSKDKVEKATPKNGEKPELVILGGRAGAGKSWFTEQEGGLYTERVNRGEFIVLDADEIKRELPEYKNWNAGTVHEESSDLNKMMLETIKEIGLNVIIDGTMANPDKMVRQVNEFKEQGYRTSCDYIFTPMQESMKRAVGRFKTRKEETKWKGRYVPLGIMTDMTKNEDAFEAVKGIVDRYSFRDNYNQVDGKPALVTQKGAY